MLVCYDVKLEIAANMKKYMIVPHRIEEFIIFRVADGDVYVKKSTFLLKIVFII